MELNKVTSQLTRATRLPGPYEEVLNNTYFNTMKDNETKKTENLSKIPKVI